MSEWLVTGETVHPKGGNPLGNRFYGYRQVDLVLPDGRPATYHGVDIGWCVHVVALEEDETTYLVRQRRPNVMPVGGRSVPKTLELPGGFADLSLTLDESAAQELGQETGRRADNMEFIGTLYPSTGISNEQDHIFMATGLSVITPMDSGEATEQDMKLVHGKFGYLYRQMQLDKLPVSAQTLAAMAKVAVRL